MKILSKKFISFLLVMLLLGSIFTGCNKKEVKKDVDSNNVKNTESKKEGKKEFAYPMDKNRKITYWGAMNQKARTQFANAGETPYWQEYIKNTGLTIEFLDPPQGQEKEQLNLMIASGELPDIIEYSWGGWSGGPEKAIQDGVIIGLNDVIKKHAPNLAKVYEEHPQWEKLAKTDAGNQYMFPFIRKDDYLKVFFGPIVRKDWLDDLGLQEPETIEDWYNMLIAFRDKKNAKSPLTYEGWMLNYGKVFMGAYGVSSGFYVNDKGTVKFGPIESGYKEFLKEFSKWYNEGLLDKDIATIDKKQVASKILNGNSGATLGFGASRLGVWLSNMKDKDQTYNIIGTKYPVLNKGDRAKFGQKDFAVTNTGVAITTACMYQLRV